jgi:hypothetical protein
VQETIVPPLLPVTVHPVPPYTHTHTHTHTHTSISLPPSLRALTEPPHLDRMCTQEWVWVLVAKRFLWQANGEDGRRADGMPRVGERVTVEWGDALSVLPKLAASGVQADLLLLDGTPSVPPPSIPSLSFSCDSKRPMRVAVRAGWHVMRLRFQLLTKMETTQAHREV